MKIDRRYVLKAMSALAGLKPLSPLGVAFCDETPARMEPHGKTTLLAFNAAERQAGREEAAVPMGVIVPMEKGPYRANGASPWYAIVTLGTPPQNLKMAIDTGTNLIWCTSSLCSSTGCRHSAGGRFRWEESSSLSWIDRAQIPYNFGPWGQMQVESGADVLRIPGQSALPVNLYLATQYASPQFSALDWDGGIGIPSGSAYVQKPSTFIVEELMNLGVISSSTPFVSFDWDSVSRRGSCRIGGVDKSRYIESEGIFMPWTPYARFDNARYLWTTPLQSYRVGPKELGVDLQFALDSGSSEFKGDSDVMNNTVLALAQFDYPSVAMSINGGELCVSKSQYLVSVEISPGKSQARPQFRALGAKGLVLVGSVLMEHCYVIYQYRVLKDQNGNYTLSPFGMYAFNKPGGPEIITRPSPDLELSSEIAPACLAGKGE